MVHQGLGIGDPAYYCHAAHVDRWSFGRLRAHRAGRSGRPDPAICATGGRRLADVSSRLRRNRLLATRANQHEERPEPPRGLVVSPPGRHSQFPGDAHRRRRLHVSAGRKPSGGARPRDRHRALAAHRLGHRAVSPRRRVLARRSWSVSHHLHGRSPAHRIGRGYGNRAAEFGTNGEVDIVVPYNSVPLVYRNVVVVGANNPPGSGGAPGNARALDARTGAKLWEFSSVAQPGSVGHDTWAGDSWKGRFGANAWPFYFTLDEERGLVYLPLASPIPGGYGGDREGANLYGNSVVAVDVLTGTYKWHFQTIHHDLWDADPPAPPGLIDIVRNGRRLPAMALTTKSGYMYILNRETGQPIFGVEERAVPTSDVPGERSFPTQPIPVKPPALARVAYRPEDLVSAADTTPEHAAACRELVEKQGGVYNAGPFTPWKFREAGATTPLSLLFPGGLGGPNWGGTASDPTSGYVYVATQDVGALGFIRKAREGAAVAYEKASPGRGGFDVPIGDESWPCQKPPWGSLVAVNAATGDFAWRVPLGITEQLPAGQAEHGAAGTGWSHCDWRRRAVRRVDRRQSFSCVRLANGQATVGDEDGAERKRQSHHVSRS